LHGADDHDNHAPSSNLRTRGGQRPFRVEQAGCSLGLSFPTEETTMAWTTPVIVEVCVGMEITSYESAEI
jgi:coenzyme PQQ precursor peptide PqqA